MTILNVQNVRAGDVAPPSLREDAARGDTPFRPPPAPSPYGLTIYVYRHRWLDGFCLNCGATSPEAVCESVARPCESCQSRPSVTWDEGFAVCLGCYPWRDEA